MAGGVVTGFWLTSTRPLRDEDLERARPAMFAALVRAGGDSTRGR